MQAQQSMLNFGPLFSSLGLAWEGGKQTTEKESNAERQVRPPHRTGIEMRMRKNARPHSFKITSSARAERDKQTRKKSMQPRV
jgi:hypothetical protein